MKDEFGHEKILIDVELPLQGDNLRFHKVSEFEAWLKEETEFWQWLRTGPAKNVSSGRAFINQHFFPLTDNLTGQLNDFRNRWNTIRNEYNQKVQSATDNDTEELKIAEKSAQEKVDSHRNTFEGQVSTFIQNELISNQHTLLSTEPEAQYAKELSESEPLAAAYFLDQVMIMKRNHQDMDGAMSLGRSTAILFRNNLIGSGSAHKKSVSSYKKIWQSELKNYKCEYDELMGQFEALSAQIQKSSDNWEALSGEYSKGFQDSVDNKNKELVALQHSCESELDKLTETYEAHMRLKGPMAYWRGKKRGHAKSIKTFRCWTIIASLVSIPLLLGMAWILLPYHHPSNVIPWRQLGFFILLSTFFLWGLRLLVKILLSHIHLHADADERETMISTYMALTRKGVLDQEQIGLVLAPIFRPSTTGVIKDEGTPLTLADFASRVAGGK